MITLPVGGRIQWETASRPNELGPIAVTGRLQRRIIDYALERLEPSTGVWEPADLALPGDSLRLVARVTPPDPLGRLDVRAGVSDASGRFLDGADRVRDLVLTEQSPGVYRQSAYLDDNFQEQSADSMLLAMHHDPAPPVTVALLRTPGPGRLLANLFDAVDGAEVDVPIQVRPGRVERNSAPLDQEGVGAPPGRLGPTSTVVPGTGEMVLEGEDCRIDGPSMTMVFDRTHRSGNRYDGPQGQGWIPSFHRRIWQIDEDELLLLDGDGHQLTFSKNSQGTWDSPNVVFARLEPTDGGWRLRRMGGFQDVFLPVTADKPNEFGLAATEDRWGNRIRWLRGHHGRPFSGLDSLRRAFELRWTGEAARLESVGDFGGSTVKYEYFSTGDANGWQGNLKSVRSPTVANPDNPFPDGRRWSFRYKPPGEDHRLHWIQDPEGSADSLGPILDMDYNAVGHVETQRYVRGDVSFTRAGDTLTWNDRRGNDHRIVFHASANDGFAQLPHQMITEVLGVDQTHELQWNPQRTLTEHREPIGNSTELVYEHLAADPRDRGNLLFRRLMPDGQRPAVVYRSVGISDFSTDPTEQSPALLEESYLYEPNFQEIRQHTDAMSRITTRVWSGPRLESETRPAVNHTVSGGGAGACAKMVVEPLGTAAALGR